VIEEHARKREHVVTRIDAKDAVRTFLVRIRYGQTSSSATKKSSDYNNEKDRATIEATFEALMRLVGDLDIESTRAMRANTLAVPFRPSCPTTRWAACARSSMSR
jgi:hypothetical protein